VSVTHPDRGGCFKDDQIVTAEFTAPLMRFVPVTNLDRTLKFYCDALGFEETRASDDYSMGAAAEVNRGPVRIQFILEKGVEVREEILFFQASDVSALRNTFAERGLNPSHLEKVNWIKMEMFEVRDPDGHVLWFGQSFDQPGILIEQPMLQQMLPHLPVDDVAGAITHYQEKLGFQINYAQADLGVMFRDRATLLLIQRSKEHSGIGSCSVYIADADKLHADLTEKGANILGPPISRPWGLRDFTVADPEGNRITFAQPFE